MLTLCLLPNRDTEIRFNVHDSPDYYNLKISVFSEDKKTDLIGETFLDLSNVIVPGGGKQDIWQGLTCKGKYAGEIRLEFTYYDSRPKPERQRRESNAATEDGSVALRQKVKRRPLPGLGGAGPGVGHQSAPSVATAESIEAFPMPAARLKHGPRDITTPPRANSLPPEMLAQQPGFGGSPAPAPQFHTPPPNGHQPDAYGQFDEQQDDMQYAQPDFLPQLPPTPRRQGGPQGPSPGMHQRGQSQGMLPHASSAPIVPTVDSGFGDYSIHMDGPEPLPDLNFQHQRMRQRRNDVPPGWENPYDDPRDGSFHEEEEDDHGPPPPPMHSHSAPVVPQSPSQSGSRFMSTPPSARQQYISNHSPLQSIERGYSSPQHTPPYGHSARGRSVDEFTPSPPQMRSYDSPPGMMMHSNMSSPAMRSPVSRALPNRHSMADIYGAPPARPHPLSQEVPRARSPMPPFSEHAEQAPFDGQYGDRDGSSSMRPRAVSPAPPASQAAYSDRRSKSTYGIQFPVRAFESSDSSPLATTSPHSSIVSPPHRPTPTRRSVSPRPSPTDTVINNSGVPYGPDSYDIHNPSTGSPLGHHSSSSSAPYHIRPDHSGAPPRDGPGGPIVGWDGREIDPSDHLPVDSWAPEPEKKTPTKTYGLGRDRDFGPRTQGQAQGGHRISADTVINFRRRSQAAPPQPAPAPVPEPPSSSPARSRLLKKSPSPSPMRSTGAPLRERPNFNSTPPAAVPDPYAQQDFSRGFYEGSPGISGGELSRYDFQKQAAYGEEAALSREIAGIDLGAPSGSTRRMPTVSSSASGWQGVRSHRDRGFY